MLFDALILAVAYAGIKIADEKGMLDGVKPYLAVAKTKVDEAIDLVKKSL